MSVLLKSEISYIWLFRNRIKCKGILVFLPCNSVSYVSNEAHPVLKQAVSSPIDCIKFHQTSRSTQLRNESRHQVCVSLCQTTYSVNSFKGTSESITICNHIKFNIKIHTTSSCKIKCTMSIFNQVFLVEFFITSCKWMLQRRPSVGYITFCLLI